jgi:hypothetical protein
MSERVIKRKVAPRLLAGCLLSSLLPIGMVRKTHHRKLSTDILVPGEFFREPACLWRERAPRLSAHGVRRRAGAALAHRVKRGGADTTRAERTHA